MQTFSLLTVSCIFALAVAYPSDFAQHNHAAQASNDVVHWSTGPNQSGATTLNNPENHVPDNKFVAKVDNGGANKDVKTEFGKVGKNLDKAWGIPTKTEHEKDAAKDHVTTTKVQSPTITTTAATTTAATTTAATTTAASTTAASTTASNTTTSTTTTSTTTSAPKYETKAATTTTSAPTPAPTPAPAPAPAPPTTFTETKVQTKDLPHAIESGPAGTGSVDLSNVHVNATTELPAQKDAKDVNAAQDVKTPLPTNEHIKSAELVDATVLKAHFAAAPAPAAEHGVKGETRAPAAATSQSLASASPAPAPAPGLSAPVPAPAAAPSSLSAADAPASAASKDEKSAEPKTAKDVKQETKNF